MGVEEENLIQAEGRVLSAKIADRLKTSVRSILEVLIDAKVMTVGDMQGLLEEAIEEESEPDDEMETDEPVEVEVSATEEPKVVETLQETPQPIAASRSLKESVGIESWFKRLATTLKTFHYNFVYLHGSQDEDLRRLMLEGAETREGVINTLMTDLIDILQELSKDYRLEYRGINYAMPYHFDLYCKDGEKQVQASVDLKKMVGRSAWYAKLATTLQNFFFSFGQFHSLPDSELQEYFLEGTETREQAIDSLMGDFVDILQDLHRSYLPEYRGMGFEPYLELPMYCASQEVELQLSEGSHAIAFDCSVTIEASAKNHNRHPVKGVLFRIDEPSEGIPSVGPGLPLLIPREVAESVLDAVSGLPLDCHDTLSQHADDEIAGVMQAAEIQGNDFVVSGILWPWSQPEKVQAIVQAKDDLGMSMNASAKGHETEFEGQKVFQIDELRLLGANILYSEKATYKKTRIAAGAATASPVEDESVSASIPIAAEATPPANNTGDDTVMEQEILVQLSALAQVVGDLKAKVDAMEVQSAQPEIKETVQAADQQSFAELVAQQVQKLVNPTGAPIRKTFAPNMATSIAAASSEKTELQLKLASKMGELKVQEELPTGAYNPTKVMQLKDEIQVIRLQLAQ